MVMGPRLVLIVDDHDAVRAGLRDWFLRVVPGFDVVEASSGEAALACAAARAPDLVLMDIQLPGMSGLEATRRIKATLPLVPVVIVTLHDVQDYRNQAAVAGACAYLLKHQLPSALIGVLADLLPSPGGEVPLVRHGCHDVS